MQYTYTLADDAEEPITLEEAKEYMKIDYETDDTLIEGLITAAREKAEEFCNRTFIDKTIVFSPDPDDAMYPFRLPFPNHHEIDSVEIDGASASYTKTGLSQFEITVAGVTSNSTVTVTYSATGDQSNKVKDVIKRVVQEMYDNRGSAISENAIVHMLPLKVYQ